MLKTIVGAYYTDNKHRRIISYKTHWCTIYVMCTPFALNTFLTEILYLLCRKIFYNLCVSLCKAFIDKKMIHKISWNKNHSERSKRNISDTNNITIVINMKVIYCNDVYWFMHVMQSKNLRKLYNIVLI